MNEIRYENGRIIAVNHQSIDCKICGSESKYRGSVEANKCCIDRTGNKFTKASSEMIPYHICTNCGFIFTTYMDQWTPDEFKAKIYNADYELLTPPIPGRTNVPVKEQPAYNKGLHIGSYFKEFVRIRLLFHNIS